MIICVYGEMESTKLNSEYIGIFCRCLSLLIKEHEPTKSVFARVKEGFLLFVNYLNEKSKGEGLAAQTGSSFDDLHLSRLLQDAGGRYKFYPPIDFDFMMSYSKYEIADKTDCVFNEKSARDFVDCSMDMFGVMFQSKNPGYVKLLVTRKGMTMLEARKERCDFHNFITKEGFLPNNVFKQKILPDHTDEGGIEVLYKRQKSSYVSSGPALSNIENEPEGYTFDFVHSFPCKSWPKIAENWIKRHKPEKWPNTELIQDIIKDGCAVVPVGHHLSDESVLEWRLSFNAAERKLSEALHPLQKSCYSLIKLLVKSCMSSKSILTSYHVKNMMFWFCEQMNGTDIWTNEALGSLFIEFIEYIIKALEHHSIPAYFLPSNNLVSHKSQDAIDETRKELVQMKNNIYWCIGLVCTKLGICEDFPTSLANKPEMQQVFTIYTVFVQLLYKIGVLNISTSIDTECFKNVVSLNLCMKTFIKRASQVFSATTLVDLLKPLAIAHMQAGENDKALRLNLIIVENERKLVKNKHPEIFTNIACGYSTRYQMARSSEEKRQYFDKTMEFFHVAENLIKDSPSLYFAIGNFLFTSKSNGSILKAIHYLSLACSIRAPRSDDEALMSIDIPGGDVNTGQVYVGGQIAACYLLACIFMAIDDIYTARLYARKLLDMSAKIAGKHRHSAYMLLSLTLKTCGLYEKATIATSNANKYKRLLTSN